MLYFSDDWQNMWLYSLVLWYSRLSWCGGPNYPYSQWSNSGPATTLDNLCPSTIPKDNICGCTPDFLLNTIISQLIMTICAIIMPTMFSPLMPWAHNCQPRLITINSATLESWQPHWDHQGLSPRSSRDHQSLWHSALSMTTLGQDCLAILGWPWTVEHPGTLHGHSGHTSYLRLTVFTLGSTWLPWPYHSHLGLTSAALH